MAPPGASSSLFLVTTLVLAGLAVPLLAWSQPARAELETLQGDDVPYDLARPSPRRTLDLYAVEARPAAPRPAVVLLHGGGWEAGSKESFGIRADSYARHSGWLVVAAGYDYEAGDRWRELPQDMTAILHWLAGPGVAQYNVDPARIGFSGTSAGGHLALLAALRQESFPPGLQVKAVSAWVAPTDMAAMVSSCADRPCPVDGGAYLSQRFAGDCRSSRCSTEQIDVCFLDAAPACPGHYSATSPVRYVDAADAHVQLWFSAFDEVVPFNQAIVMEEALQRAGVPFDCIRSDTVGHEAPPNASTSTFSFLRSVLDGDGRHLRRECVP